MGVWIDESSKDDRTFLRHYGRAPRGRRAIRRDKLPKGQRYSILPALTVDAGYIAMRVVRGSVKSMTFLDFVLNDVLPRTNPYPGDRSVLIMDNCRIHKCQTLRQAIEAAGAYVSSLAAAPDLSLGRRLVFIPPYSPEFNPIEESFSSRA
ncbi:hypothetical protein EXIGLDRAFT_618493 [Exidia glandulosa HHB12029]|uniref:Tc1-like transposase DDE domain-containing protein n=1 Tax=Exidia glandulosa HHB12029 TaxID=1314781 RepID=A0A165FKU7_EXIGL|nr:hypothetical protein EXIGLDRAFT_618493 [Exidia glandulosa HHB12029]